MENFIRFKQRDRTNEYKEVWLFGGRGYDRPLSDFSFEDPLYECLASGEHKAGNEKIFREQTEVEEKSERLIP